MRKNTLTVYAAWKQGKAKGNFGDSISTDGKEIWSYSAPLLFRSFPIEDLLLNITHYSKTTSCQQSDLRFLLRQDAIEYRNIEL